MNLGLISRFVVKMRPLKKLEKERASFFKLAKKNVIAKKGKKENLALKIDEILYGKQ